MLKKVSALEQVENWNRINKGKALNKDRQPSACGPYKNGEIEGYGAVRDPKATEVKTHNATAT